MNADELLTLSHATERDVDLLLVEELVVSREAAQWLSAQVGWKPKIGEWSVSHSKRRTQNRREIDIELRLVGNNSNETAILLIENKLGESPQPGQAESYREECLSLVKKGACRFAASILFCPGDYQNVQRDFARKFDSVVHYENFAEFLGSRASQCKSTEPELHARLTFRIELLKQAIGKLRRGYEPVPLPHLGTFNSQYVALLAKLAPSILPGPSMLKAANPAESVSMIYDHVKTFEALPPNIRPRRFAHEFGRGQSHRANYVAVAFGGWGRKLETFKEALQADLGESAYRLEADRPSAKRPNPALRIIMATPPVDNHGLFEMQRFAIESGMREAVKLQKWLLQNAALLHRWREQLQ